MAFFQSHCTTKRIKSLSYSCSQCPEAKSSLYMHLEQPFDLSHANPNAIFQYHQKYKSKCNATDIMYKQRRLSSTSILDLILSLSLINLSTSQPPIRIDQIIRQPNMPALILGMLLQFLPRNHHRHTRFCHEVVGKGAEENTFQSAAAS